MTSGERGAVPLAYCSEEGGFAILPYQCVISDSLLQKAHCKDYQEYCCFARQLLRLYAL